MKRENTIVLVIAFLLCACSKKEPISTPDVGSHDAATDTRTLDVATPDLRVDLPTARIFELLGSQPETTRLGQRRGRDVVRGLIHAHSVHSHDACDGKPELEDGSPNEPCLADFRNGICETRQDYVFLTEHEDLAAYHDFDEISLIRGDDEPVVANGRVVGNRMTCDNGHVALIMPGGEFNLMPIGLTDHLPGTPEERDAQYSEVTPERVESYRDLGGVVLQSHAESRDRDELRQLGLDGFEVYQLHANVDPNIREDWLGLERFTWLDAATPFIQGNAGHPDLVFLSFVEPNPPSVAHFDALVSEGQHLTGTGGTDCHQNVLNLEMSDGERIDGYRRMMRWFSNHLFVDRDGPLDPESLKGAVRDGRLAIVFEILGTPQNHDFYVETPTGTYEMGESAPLSEQTVIHLPRPDVLTWGEVAVELEIIKIEATGGVVVAEGDQTLAFTPTEPGAYRAIVSITPTYLAPHLEGDAIALADKTYEWIWFNPVYIAP